MPKKNTCPYKPKCPWVNGKARRCGFLSDREECQSFQDFEDKERVEYERYEEYTNPSFGKGFCYCLGLYLQHTEALSRRLEQDRRIKEDLVAKGKPEAELFNDDRTSELWVYGAGDHLLDMEIDSIPKILQKRARELKKRVLAGRFSFSGEGFPLKEAWWTLDEARDLLREVDKFLKIPTEKTQCS